MSKRYAALYSDGSLNIFSAGKDLIQSRKELEMSTDDGETELVEVEIKIIATHGPKEVKQYIHSVECPTCKEQIDIEPISQDNS